MISLNDMPVRNRTIFIFFCLIGLLAYLNSFNVPFHYDDIYYLKENIQVKSFSRFWNWLSEDYSRIFTGRPLLLFTFFLNYKFGGIDTFGYHLLNLLIHIANAFLIYLILFKYADTDNPPIPPLEKGGQGGFKKDYSLKYALAAVLFLIHPLNTESVTYISSRSSVLSAFFVLAAMLCFFRATFYRHPINNFPSPSPQSPPIKGGETKGVTPIEGGDIKVVSSPLWKITQKFPSPLVGEGRGEGGFMGRKFHAGYYTLSIFFFILGLSTKEAAIVLPALLILFDYFFISKNSRNLLSRIKYYLPYLVLISALSILYMHYITSPSEGGWRPWPVHILTEIKVFAEYLKLLIFPMGLNIDHDVKISNSIDVNVLISFLVFLSLFVAAMLLRKSKKIIAFSIFWFFINLMPFLVIRLDDFMAERWMYLASVGISIGLSDVLVAKRLRKLGIVTAAAVVVIFGTLTVLRNHTYTSPILLWGDAVKKSPDNYRPYLNLGNAYRENGNPAKAIEYTQEGIKRGRKGVILVVAYINLAAAYEDMKEYKKAEEALKSVEKYTSDYYAYQHNLGTLYTKMGKFEEALVPFKKALKMRPDSTMILFSIGRCYEEISKNEEAREYFMLAVKSTPRNGREYISQGMSFLKLGNDEKALECFFEAVRVDPLDINVRIHLAKTLFGIGYFDGAFKHYSTASEISPNNAPAYKGMGLVMLEKGDSKEAKKYLDKALNLLPPDSPERKEILELLDKTKG